MRTTVNKTQEENQKTKQRLNVPLVSFTFLIQSLFSDRNNTNILDVGINIYYNIDVRFIVNMLQTIQI